MGGIVVEEVLKKGFMSIATSILLPILFIILSVAFLTAGVVATFQANEPTQTRFASTKNAGLPAEVLRWKDLVEQITAEEGIPETASVILAIIAVESGGTALDVMQSSESQGLAPNTIIDPEESIRVGVKAFKRAYQKTQLHKMDILVAAAGYNYGNAFIDWLAANGGDYSLEKSEEYSRTVVAPSLGNTTGETYSYPNPIAQKLGKPYLYLNGGNFFYPELVKQYLTANTTEDSEQSFTGDGTFKPPFSDYIVTSPFGSTRNLVLQDGTPLVNNVHTGTDMVPTNGDQYAPIPAVADGVVVFAGWGGMGGNMVIIQHEDHLYTHYCHLSVIHTQVGFQVTQGDIIGNMGSTGASTAPHLHLGASTEMNSGYFDVLTLFQ